jgi:transcriptional regulator with XRE-family HTH domain
MAHLSELRRRKPLTQAELATLTHVSEATIRAIENGYAGRFRGLHPRTMRAIAAALEVEPDDVEEFRSSLGLTPSNREPRGR